MFDSNLVDGCVKCMNWNDDQADNVAEERRASTFGVLSGIGSSAFVCGTLFTRFLSTSSTFQVNWSSTPFLSLSSTLSCLEETNHGLIVLLLGCDVGGGGISYVLEDFPAGFQHRQETFCSITLRWKTKNCRLRWKFKGSNIAASQNIAFITWFNLLVEN